MRYSGSFFSGNVFLAGAVSISVLNSPGAQVIVASQVGNSVGGGSGPGLGFGGGVSLLAIDERGLPGL